MHKRGTGYRKISVYLSVCLSVCPSDTIGDCIKTAYLIDEIHPPRDSPNSLFYETNWR